MLHRIARVAAHLCAYAAYHSRAAELPTGKPARLTVYTSA